MRRSDSREQQPWQRHKANGDPTVTRWRHVGFSARDDFRERTSWQRHKTTRDPTVAREETVDTWQIARHQLATGRESCRRIVLPDAKLRLQDIRDHQYVVERRTQLGMASGIGSICRPFSR
jgi:hypothetical protein